LEELMPRATASVFEPEKHDLKSLPGGYVLLRRLTYGQKLERRAMSSMASAETQGRGKQNMKLTMAMVNQQATLYDFTHCIVDHNLEDDQGNKMNLTDSNVIKLLDPRVGDEIEQLLDKLNNFEEDEELGDSEHG
jgi:hypothetical protein